MSVSALFTPKNVNVFFLDSQSTSCLTVFLSQVRISVKSSAEVKDEKLRLAFFHLPEWKVLHSFILLNSSFFFLGYHCYCIQTIES